MEREYEKLFAQVDHQLPSEGLVERIVATIAQKDKKRAQIRFIYSTTILAASVIAFVPAIQYLGSEATQSGFFQYISLMFSDGALLATFWKEFSFSLAESFPVFGTLATFSTGFAFLFALRNMIPTYIISPKIKHQFN
ncbi:MAG: hypothetical protein WCV80_01405 [Candidatus Paceibacterota bacterium]|jgi:hypothetical protein